MKPVHETDRTAHSAVRSVRLRRDVRVIQVDEQTVDLISETSRHRIRLPTSLQARLIGNLRLGVGLDKLTEDEVLIFRKLTEVHLAYYFDPTSWNSCYTPQLEYFAAFTSDPGTSQQKLTSSHVAIVGVGGVGTVLVDHLVRAGVGRLTLIDSDSVSEQNLHRQMCFLHSDIGRPKTHAAADYARSIRPGIEITCHETTIDTVDTALACIPAAVDLVVCAADKPPGKVESILIELTNARETAYATAAVGVRWAHIGPLLLSGDRTGRANHMQAVSELSKSLDVPTAAFGPYNTVVSARLAQQLIHHLAGLPTTPEPGQRILLSLEGETRHE